MNKGKLEDVRGIVSLVQTVFRAILVTVTMVFSIIKTQVDVRINVVMENTLNHIDGQLGPLIQEL
jgi:hypothetical protein